MLYRDQKKIKKLKRRIVLLIFLLSASIYWSVVKYHEHQFTIGENEMLFNELITTQSERDSLIRVLKQQTPKLEETKPVVKKQNPKKETQQLIDTLKKDYNVPKIIESEPVIYAPKDTLNR